MAQTPTPGSTVRISRPGCRANVDATSGSMRVVCPNCAKAVVFFKCPSTAKAVPILEHWVTWSHPGCAITHSVAEAIPAPKLPPGMTAADRDAWLEPGELILVDTRIAPVREDGNRKSVSVISRKAKQVLVVATDRRIRIGDDTFLYTDMLPVEVTNSSRRVTSTSKRTLTVTTTTSYHATHPRFVFEDGTGRRVVLLLHSGHYWGGNQVACERLGNYLAKLERRVIRPAQAEASITGSDGSAE